MLSAALLLALFLHHRTLALPEPRPIDATVSAMHLNVSSNVEAAIEAAMPAIATPSLGPIAEPDPNLLPLLIYQGTPEEPCTNINSPLKATQYVWADDNSKIPGDKTTYPHCWDFGIHNITCLIVGRVGRTFADLNGLVESNCGPSGPSEFGQLGIYNDSFGNAYTWGPQNGGSISSFSFAPYLNRPLPPSLQPKPVPWP